MIDSDARLSNYTTYVEVVLSTSEIVALIQLIDAAPANPEHQRMRKALAEAFQPPEPADEPAL